MRVLVCGDREWSDAVEVHCVLHRFTPDDTIVHGACRGADQIAGQVAKSLGIQVEEYPADWARYRGAAGPIRNQQMLDTGIDLVIAFHEDINKSKGTNHMVTIATKADIPVEIYNGQ